MAYRRVRKQTTPTSPNASRPRSAQASLIAASSICGTGIGMAIAANKVPGIRAAVVHDVYSAERSRKSNNAQILAMGSLVIGPKVARQLVSVWLDSEFQGGASARKIQKIALIEEHFQLPQPGARS